MSMFSIHYLISNSEGKYWTGKNLADPAAWTKDGRAVRFYGRESAEAVVKGVLSSVKCKIEEDE